LEAQASINCLEQVAVVSAQLPNHNAAEAVLPNIRGLECDRRGIVIADPNPRFRAVEPRHLRVVIPKTREEVIEIQSQYARMVYEAYRMAPVLLNSFLVQSCQDCFE
jgi:hypothetical protein